MFFGGFYQVRQGRNRGAPFDDFTLPAVTRQDWDLPDLIRFLLRLMTSQTSGTGQDAPRLAGGPRNNKVYKLFHAIAYAQITILTHRFCSTGSKVQNQKMVLPSFVYIFLGRNWPRNYKSPSPSPPTRFRIFRLCNFVGPFQSVQPIPDMLKLTALTTPLFSYAGTDFIDHASFEPC
jgi:hypothetical protein